MVHYTLELTANTKYVPREQNSRLNWKSDNGISSKTYSNTAAGHRDNIELVKIATASNLSPICTPALSIGNGKLLCNWSLFNAVNISELNSIYTIFLSLEYLFYIKDSNIRTCSKKNHILNFGYTLKISPTPK